MKVTWTKSDGEVEDISGIFRFIFWSFLFLFGFIFIILLLPSNNRTITRQPEFNRTVKNVNPLASVYAYKLCEVMGRRFISHDNESVITCADKQTGQLFVYPITSYDRLRSNDIMEGKF